MLPLWKKSYDQPRQHIIKQIYYFAGKGLSSQSYGFFSSHVWIWKLDHKESWALKNWCFWTVVDAFELWCWRRLLRAPWMAKRSQQSIKINPEYSLEVQFSSVTQSCLTLCNPMNCSTPGLPVHHQLPEYTQNQVHRVGDAIQPSHPLSSPSCPALNLSQHQGFFKWVSSSHQAAKVLEFQLQHQSFQWTPWTHKTDLL